LKPKQHKIDKIKNKKINNINHSLEEATKIEG